MRRVVSFLVPAALLAVGLAAADPQEDLGAAAARAYEQGRCGEVLNLYRQLEQAGGKLDGVAEYRAGFCNAYVNRSDARPYYERAAEKLAEEVAGAGAPLEGHFYRVNALLNLGRGDDARAAAAEAVARFRDGELTVPEGRPEAWFRLGKLFRDSGDLAGGLPSLTRAVEAAEAGTPLRDAYVERIARWAGDAGDQELAQRASALLERGASAGAGSLARLGRSRLAAGDAAGALEAFRQASKQKGEAGLAARYAALAVERTLELEKWGLEPARTMVDGRPISGLSDAELQGELAQSSRLAWQAISGRSVEVPRKKRGGTRPAPHPQTLESMRLAQVRFAGALIEAVKRGAPLRELNVQMGLGPLIYHPWYRLHLQQAEKKRSGQLVQTPQR